MKVACLLFESPAPTQEVAELCYRWSPQIAVSSEAVFLEVSRCGRLYSERTLLLRLTALAKRYQIPGRVAMAEDIPTALAKARYQMEKKENFPVESLQDYLSPFGRTSELEKMLRSLYRAGIGTLGDFARIPRRMLASRFGKEALLAANLVADASLIPWPRFQPEEKILERLEIEEARPLENLEPLFFLLKSVTDRAVGRLHGRGLRAARIEVRIFMEKSSVVKETLRSFMLDFPVPQSSLTGFFLVLRERLDRECAKTPLLAPLTAIELEVVDTVPGSFFQRNFFHTDDVQKESWESLLLRLQERLGKEKFFYADPIATHRPERNYKLSLEKPKDFLPPVAARPTRLFPVPEPIRRIDHMLIGLRNNKKWRVEKESGPEKISGDWWRLPFAREYFRVKTKEGETLWIFSSKGRWYLHGVFD